MTAAVFTCTLDDAAMQGALRRVVRLMGNPAPLLKKIGMGLVAAADERFETQTDPWGRRWDDLVQPYAELKATMQPTSDRILTRSGKLARSLHYTVDAREVAYGSSMIYAAVHQFGATIRPKNGPYLVFPLMYGGIAFLEHRSQVEIPARPYLGMGPAEVEAVELATQIQMAKVWRG